MLSGYNPEGYGKVRAKSLAFSEPGTFETFQTIKNIPNHDLY
jgi:hypothetical protein